MFCDKTDEKWGEKSALVFLFATCHPSDFRNDLSFGSQSMCPMMILNSFVNRSSKFWLPVVQKVVEP